MYSALRRNIGVRTIRVEYPYDRMSTLRKCKSKRASSMVSGERNRRSVSAWEIVLIWTFRWRFNVQHSALKLPLLEDLLVMLRKYAM